MNGREPGDPEDDPAPDPAELDLSVLEIPILTEVLEPPATPSPVAPVPGDPEPDQPL
ncbi:MAG: hypothetical protein HYX64_01200 [Gammaproteobacteria bacterium]|nr:hypothetical protein [Gammaproteobacteria bacterium]